VSKFVATHTGILTGDARNDGKSISVSLRETRLYWVSKSGAKYRKVDGWQAGVDYPMWTLTLESVKPIGKE
jgi:hypothetical protein